MAVDTAPDCRLGKYDIWGWSVFSASGFIKGLLALNEYHQFTGGIHFINHVDQYMKEIGKYKKGDTLSLYILRNNRGYVAITLTK